MSIARTLWFLMSAEVIRAAAPAAVAQTLTGEWWVVLGTSPAPDATGMEFPDALRASEAAERCGLATMGDFTAKFDGFAPDLYVSVAGGWDSRADWDRTIIRKYAMEGPQEHDAQPPGSNDDTDDTQPKQLSFAY